MLATLQDSNQAPKLHTLGFFVCLHYQCLQNAKQLPFTIECLPFSKSKQDFDKVHFLLWT